MIYAKQNSQRSSYAQPEYIRLRDQHGVTWRGSREKDFNNNIQYRVRDASGKAATGIADSFGVILQDCKGNTWRAFQE